MQVEQQSCRHHWMIQPAEGPMSLGVCRLCHEEKEFQNTMDDWGFYPEHTKAPNRAALSAALDEDD